MSEPIRVTAFDPNNGETRTRELGPNDYILIVGEHMEVGSLARYANGTVQITIKRKAETK